MNGGPAQTRYFMQELIDHLSPSEQSYLRDTSLSILDWGCATGEGVTLLALAFPLCRVAGLDIARSAIESAHARYPQHEFILSEDGAIPRLFDVILTSNVLEHYQDPLTMARAQATQSRLLYIVLVPFQEDSLTDGHLLRFNEDSFPIFCGGLVRLCITPFETRPEFWAGGQLLVVYASQAYLAARRPGAARLDSEQIQNWEIYFQSPPKWQALLEDLALRRAQAESALRQAILVRDLMAAKVEKLERLRQRLAPVGTRRRRWLNRLTTWLRSRA